MHTRRPRRLAAFLPRTAWGCLAALAGLALGAPTAPVARAASGPLNAWESRPGFPDPRPGIPDARPGPDAVQEVQADSLHEFDVTHYRLDLTFPCVSTSLSGACTITLKSRQSPMTSVALDFVSLTADSVKQSGVPAAFSTASGVLHVTLPAPVSFGDSTVLRIVYHGTAVRGYYSAAPETWFTMAEPSDARYWFPCYDQPWDKATSEIHATVPDTMFVASNGVQTASPTVDSVNHRKTYHWGTGYPISTYLMSVAITHYVELRDSALYVPLRSYVLKADSANAVYDFYRLPQMVNFYGSLWGQYPFEKYGMAAVKNFGGGMEHQTMTTIGRSWITGTRQWEWGFAHELGHMWWGDRVTCLTWPNIWVNEGFASYADIMFTEHTYGLDSARTRLADWARRYYLEDTVASYAIYNPPSSYLFGNAIYYKGAWVLHMLRHVMGDSAFVRGWRDYGNSDKYGNGTCQDFQASEEAEYGGSLSWFFNTWIYDRGYPVYRISRNTVPRAGGGSYNYVTLQQEQTGGVPIYDMPVDLMLHTAHGDSLVTVRDSQGVQTFEFAMAAPLDSVTVDPGKWLLCKLAPPGVAVSAPASAAPGRLRLAAVHPGRGVVEFEIQLPPATAQGGARLDLFGLTGRRLATVWRGRNSGSMRVRWDGRLEDGGTAGSGIYFARLSGAGQSDAAKVLWMK